jgi:hypothetical protein
MGASRSFGERLFGALKLDATVYEEVEHDNNALGQAATVVALVAIAQGLGAFAVLGVGGSLLNLVTSFLGWFLSTALVWLIGVKLLSHTSDYLELLRTLGFASAPGLLAVLGILPLGVLAPWLYRAIFVLSLIAWVIAARQALDVGTGRAAVICAIALLIPLVLSGLLVWRVIGMGEVPQPGALPGGMGF